MSNSNKQTSVEWLVSKLPQRMLNYLKEEIEQAKTMEKQQIIEAYNKGVKAGIGDYIDTEWGRDTNELTAEQYYNETYGGNTQTGR